MASPSGSWHACCSLSPVLKCSRTARHGQGCRGQGKDKKNRSQRSRMRRLAAVPLTAAQEAVRVPTAKSHFRTCSLTLQRPGSATVLGAHGRQQPRGSAGALCFSGPHACWMGRNGKQASKGSSLLKVGVVMTLLSRVPVGRKSLKILCLFLSVLTGFLRNALWVVIVLQDWFCCCPGVELCPEIQGLVDVRGKGLLLLPSHNKVLDFSFCARRRQF